MEVRCERCRAQYAFADDQVGEHGLTVRCSNCGHLFKVKKKALAITMPVSPEDGSTPISATETDRAAARAAAGQPAAEERRDWSLRQPAGQTYTFKDMSTLHRWIVERKAHREDEISRFGEPWRRLGSIPELQSFFAVVEAAERAAYAPPSQPTMVQFPAPVLPAPAPPPPPPRARTEVAFPAARTDAALSTPAAPRRTEVAFPATPAPQRTEVAFPATAAPRTEVAFPAARTDAAFPTPPPPPRTEVAFPASAPPRTEIAFPKQGKSRTPLPTRSGSSIEELFTPTSVPAADPFAPAIDPFAPRAAAAAETVARPAATGTEQGFPTPPAPSAAPVRSPSAAWESGAASAPPAPRGGREPAWTSADQQTVGALLEKTAARSAQGKGGSLLALGLLMAAIGSAAVWYYWTYLRAPPPQAASAPQGAPQEAKAPAPEPAKQAEAPARPAEPAPAAAKQAEPAPVAANGPEAAPAGDPAKAAGEPPRAAPADAASGAEGKPAEPAAGAGEAPAAARAEGRGPSGPVPGTPGAVASAKRPPEPKGAKGFISQARRLRDRGRTQEALEIYGKAVALEPDNAAALAGRGWCYLDLSQYGPAEASFESSLEADPRGADALLGLAETYRYAGRRADAVKFYERYLAAHPKGEDAVAAQNAIQSLKE
jgi:predicted Zn finger-like uncharacterized protein